MLANDTISKKNVVNFLKNDFQKGLLDNARLVGQERHRKKRKNTKKNSSMRKCPYPNPQDKGRMYKSM